MAEKSKGNVDVKGTHGNVSGLVVSDQVKTEAPSDDPKTEEVVKLVRLAVQESTSVYSGPIPSPEALKKYGQVLPGLADRIVSAAEGESRTCLKNRDA